MVGQNPIRFKVLWELPHESHVSRMLKQRTSNSSNKNNVLYKFRALLRVLFAPQQPPRVTIVVHAGQRTRWLSIRCEARVSVLRFPRSCHLGELRPASILDHLHDFHDWLYVCGPSVETLSCALVRSVVAHVSTVSFYLDPFAVIETDCSAL